MQKLLLTPAHKKILRRKTLAILLCALFSLVGFNCGFSSPHSVDNDSVDAGSENPVSGLPTENSNTNLNHSAQLMVLEHVSSANLRGVILLSPTAVQGETTTDVLSLESSILNLHAQLVDSFIGGTL